MHDNHSVKPDGFGDGGSDARIPDVRLPFAHDQEVREDGEDDVSGAPHEGEVCRHGARHSHVEPEEGADESDEDRVEAPRFCGGGQGFMDGGSVGNASFRRHRDVLSSGFMHGASSSLRPPRSKTPGANANAQIPSRHHVFRSAVLGSRDFRGQFREAFDCRSGAKVCGGNLHSVKFVLMNSGHHN